MPSRRLNRRGAPPLRGRVPALRGRPRGARDSVRPSIHDWRRALLSEHGPRQPLARLVALALAQCMDDRTSETFAGAEHIAMRTGLSERAVRTHLKSLCRDGWLTERIASQGRAHWRRIRRATIPTEVAANGAGSPRQVPARDAGTHGHRVAANGVMSGGKSLQRVAAPRAAYLVDLSRSDLGATEPVRSGARTVAPKPKRLSTVSWADIDSKASKLIAAGHQDAEIVSALAQYRIPMARVRKLRREVRS